MSNPLVKAFIYFDLFVKDTFYRISFSGFHQGYLKFAKQELCLLYLCHVGESEIYILDYLRYILSF
jgi:hypothetical protein